MSSYSYYAYNVGAIDFSGGTDALDPGYNVHDGRVRIEVTDDDALMDGDDGKAAGTASWDDTTTDEISNDANQTAVVIDTDGNPLAKGPIYAEKFY